MLPALCVFSAEDDTLARNVIEALEEERGDGSHPDADWTCGSCKEEVPKEFGGCWNCGADHEGGE